MRRLLIAVVVLAVIAVVADRVAESVAEDQVAAKIQEREGLSEKPDVDVAGFPFLTQALSGNFGKITVSLGEVDAGVSGDHNLRVVDVEATFHDVVTSDRFSRATAGSLEGRAAIPFESLNDLGQIETSYAGTNPSGDGLITIASSSPDIPGSIDVGVSVRDGSISFVGADGTTRIGDLPARLNGAIGALLGTGHPMVGLPDDFAVTSLEVTEDGVVLELGGSDITLAG